jgi:glycosyltransferase involved in cell wall biosynthesis
MLMEHVQAPVTLAFLGATNIVAALARHGLPTRLVISERNDPARQQLQPVWQELRPLMYRAADVVTANSLGAVETMRAWMPASRLAHVPNPLRVPPDPGTRRLRDGPRFISVGRLVPQKRVDLVLEAFARLDGLDDWSFEVLGDGPERIALGELVERRGIAGRTRFYGYVDPFPHLYAADIFILASDFEGMPNALLEAMACGVVPIVNDATPGPLEFVEHDRTGLVLPAGDLDALTAAMRELAGDELRRARLSAAARERMSDLAFDHVLDSWAGVLKLPEPAAAAAAVPRLAQVAR